MRFNQRPAMVVSFALAILVTMGLGIVGAQAQQQVMPIKPTAVRPEQAAELQSVRRLVGQGRSVVEIQTAWSNFLQKSKDVDVKAAIALVLQDKKLEAKGRMEEMCRRVQDDEQLANIDLQNMLQKEQQTLQMISNISKMMHDTAKSVIRNLK